MDYRALLIKFLAHVTDCEGIDFTDRLNDYASDQKFTEYETSELQRLSQLAQELRG